MKVLYISLTALFLLGAVSVGYAADQAESAKAQPQTQAKSATHKKSSSDAPVYTCYADFECEGKVLGKTTDGGCPGIADANSQMRSDDPYCMRVIHYHPG